ncbi:tetratricopeptide repeat protein [Methanobrevibacter sp.]|uniref:tetratricopeptide repeat protein n=1 Tax=Methanobrevibacter sp. TaxID=66852 RepID=UPI0025CBDF3C|nr:tetratricopeptide repeat protein [Methanobrevibacter sp.]MBR4448188.1 tetratricopeptide repeat protein [Methanobrevibacter sp.]
MNDKQYNQDELLIQKGYVLYLQRDYDNALECLDEVLNNDPDNLWAFFYKLKVLKDMDLCTDFNSLFIRIKESNPDYYLSLSIGEFFLELEMFDESLFCFDLSLKKNSKTYNAWVYKGLCLKEMGRYDEALKSLDASLKLSPYDPISWNCKGLVYNSIEDWDNAIRCFDKCLMLDSNYISAIVNKATSYYKKGKTDESIDCCELALSMDCENYQIWDNYATFLAAENRFEESLKAYDEALKLSHNDLKVLENKLILLYNMKDWESLSCLCDKIIDIDNTIYWVWDYKIQALKQLNKQDEIISAQEELLKIFPDKKI